MNQPPHHTDPARPATTPLWQALAGWVRLGLVHFWQQALPKDNGLLRLLQDEAQSLLGGQQYTAHSLQQALKKQWRTFDERASSQDSSEPLLRLIHEYRLNLMDTFLLTLLGETQRSHVISLVITQLQAPSPSPHPTLHLCAAILESLQTEPEQPFQLLNLPQHPLIRAGLIQRQGNHDSPQTALPLPLQSLSLPAAYWSVLLGQANGWEDCDLLRDGDLTLLPDALQQQLPVLAALLQQGSAHTLVLRGHPHSGRRQLAQALARALGLQAIGIPLARWQQDPALPLACRYAHWLPVLEPKLGPGEVWHPNAHTPASATRPQPQVILLGSDGAVEGAADGRLGDSQCLELVMPLPDQRQRQSIWAQQAGCPELAAHCARNALLSGPTIASLAASAQLLAQRDNTPLALHHITQARQQLGSERLRLLAQPEPRQVDRAAIVLPPLVDTELQRLIQRAQQRESLWQGLGATLQQTFTAGVRALFIGESGTGKTLAASYIATQLGSPLYRVDLSAVMNKYIGESEKNLSAVLDMAAASDVVLLFDEADSLFGKRSEGKETGERFANMLTHFLLTRIENHPGIVILTSNNRERIDAAFTRRLDLIVEFPIPGFEERLQLWRSHLGERGPGDDIYRLLASYCDFCGGQLRNVVLAAAVNANHNPITAADLLVGLLAEYRKLGRELPGKLNLLRNWHANDTQPTPNQHQPEPTP